MHVRMRRYSRRPFFFRRGSLRFLLPVTPGCAPQDKRDTQHTKINGVADWRKDNFQVRMIPVIFLMLSQYSHTGTWAEAGPVPALAILVPLSPRTIAHLLSRAYSALSA